MPAQIERFDTLEDGQDVHIVAIGNGRLSAKILTYGATVQDLRLAGVDHPLVLGAPTLPPYLGPLAYFGAIVGRYANRIGKGRFEIDGQTYQTDRNFRGRHTLHGGAVGAGGRVWRIEEIASDRVTLGLQFEDGEMGFPGEMSVLAEIAVTEDTALDIGFTATTTRATPCSFAHHGYFNLDGSEDIRGHTLQIAAASYLPVDDDLIPTGEIAPVEGTKFDFRMPREIGDAGYDHNFCLSDGPKPMRPVARLTGPRNGLAMRVETTEAGLQVYDAAHLPEGGIVGLDGRRYGTKAGLALETQHWPDAPNRAGFPDAVLRPGETYKARTRYVFEPA